MHCLIYNKNHTIKNEPVHYTIPAPSGLTCEALRQPSKALILDPNPELGWVVESNLSNDFQTAFQILVASDKAKLNIGKADMWYSGKRRSTE